MEHKVTATDVTAAWEKARQEASIVEIHEIREKIFHEFGAAALVQFDERLAAVEKPFSRLAAGPRRT